MVTLVSGTFRYLTLDEQEKYPRFKYVTTSESKYIDENGRVITVPVGFLTDGNSGGPSTGRSWMIHDWLYSEHKFDSGEPCSRRQADKIMQDILGHEGLCIYRMIFIVVCKLNPCCALSSAWESSGERGAMFMDNDDEDS